MLFNSITIIIPLFNEAATIESVIRKVIAADTLGLKKDIIVVDDGSKDGGGSIAEKFGPEGVRLITKSGNYGKGAAVRTGVLCSEGDIVLIQDADLEYDPADYPALLSPIVSGRADVVYGSRFVSSNPHRVLYFWHFVSNVFLTLLSNMLTNLNLTDMETGYKVFRGDLIRNAAPFLECRRFDFEPEITAVISKIPAVRIYEVGISYFGRTYAEGKKIRFIDAVHAIYAILRYNIIFRK